MNFGSKPAQFQDGLVQAVLDPSYKGEPTTLLSEQPGSAAADASRAAGQQDAETPSIALHARPFCRSGQFGTFRLQAPFYLTAKTIPNVQQDRSGFH